MKKFLKLLLVVAAVCVFLVCCGGESEETKPLSTEIPVQTEGTTGKEETVPQTEALAVIINEAVIYDDDSVTITVKGLEENWSGVDIKLLVENKTDKNIAVSGSDVVVNGVTMSGYLYIDVGAGKKSNGTISLYSSDLEVAGIEEIATIRTCDAHVIDTDSFNTLAEIELSIVTSLGENYVQELDESGELLYESNGVQVIAKVMKDEFYGKSLLLYVKNTGEKDVTVQAENISINGFTMDAWLYDLVCAGTSRFCELDLWESGLEENDIEQIEDVAFTICLTDPQSYSTIAKSEELQVFLTE